MSEYAQLPRKAHLSKSERLPKTYKEVEKVLAAVKNFKGSVKTVLYNSRLRGAVFNKVYSLSVNVLKHRPILDRIIDEVDFQKREPFLRKEMASILIYELLFSKGLPEGSKPVATVMKYREELEKAHSKAIKDGIIIEDLPTIPKYVRVNTILTSVTAVLQNLEECNFQQIQYSENIEEIKYYDVVKTLEKKSFLIDYHFKDLLVFSPNEHLPAWPLYKQGHVFIQDKSSYIPVCVLDPPPGSVVLDACAAPGMKTLHIAASMQNKGIIYAFERDQGRFEVLKNTIKMGHVKICQPTCGDFYALDPRDPKFSTVEYILVDPSCSGSGMVSRMDNITDSEDSKNSNRITKLAGFQILLLKHALLFPSVKKVVYSTCSINEEENEYVVHEVLNHFNRRFRLCHVIPDWPIRGSDKFEFGHLCVRTYSDRCLTNGFFVAAFERIEMGEFEDPEFLQCNEKLLMNWKSKKCNVDGSEDAFPVEMEDQETAAEEINKKHKKKRRKGQKEISQVKTEELNDSFKDRTDMFLVTMEDQEIAAGEFNKKQKKGKHKSMGELTQSTTIEFNDSFSVVMEDQKFASAEVPKKHKKKKTKHESIEKITQVETGLGDSIHITTQESDSFLVKTDVQDTTTGELPHKHKKKKGKAKNQWKK